MREGEEVGEERAQQGEGVTEGEGVREWEEVREDALEE